MSFDRKGKPKTGPDWRRAAIAWQNRAHLPHPNGEVHHYGMTDLGTDWCQVHRRMVRLKGEKVAEGTAGVVAVVTHCCDEGKCEQRSRLVLGVVVSCRVGEKMTSVNGAKL